MPLDDDCAEVAADVARITRTPPSDTCPLACVRAASPWVVEVTEAVALAGDWHVPIETTLGREPTAVDIQALAALKRAQGDAWKSNQQIAEQKRKTA